MRAQILGNFVSKKQKTPGNFENHEIELKRIWRLECRQAGLQRDGEDGLACQLEESIVLMSKLLDQSIPSLLVQNFFVRR